MGELSPMAWQLLDQAVQAAGQVYTKVGTQLGISRAAVSTAHRHCYPGDTTRLDARIIERLGQVDCPGQGTTITLPACRDWQARPYDGANHATVRMYRACRACSRFEGGTKCA